MNNTDKIVSKIEKEVYNTITTTGKRPKVVYVSQEELSTLKLSFQVDVEEVRVVGVKIQVK